MNTLDRLARASAETRSTHEPTLTRRELAARGLLGLLALGVSSRIGAASVAFGATTPCKSLATCLKKAESTAVDVFWQCQGTKGSQWIGSGGEWTIESLGCRLWAYQPAARKAQRTCLEKCPPPPKGPRPKKPPLHAPAPPPALPPNPYGPISDECANCASVGGHCCSGRDPAHLCACAAPGYDCAERYGCG
jgi:hypothetical protein